MYFNIFTLKIIKYSAKKTDCNCFLFKVHDCHELSRFFDEDIMTSLINFCRAFPPLLPDVISVLQHLARVSSDFCDVTLDWRDWSGELNGDAVLSLESDVTKKGGSHDLIDRSRRTFYKLVTKLKSECSL